MVAVCTLSAAVYGLFPAEAGNAGIVTKAQLCSLCEKGFAWPGESAVQPNALPALAKNIAKNFMDHFFKGEGRSLVRREVDRLKPQVALYSICLHFSLLFLVC